MSDNFLSLRQRLWKFFWRYLIGLISICLVFSLAACSPPQRVSATERMFRNFSLEFIERYEIPKIRFQDTVVGGLSAIAYDRQQDWFYVLSDDRARRSPARFYTFKLKVQQADDGRIEIDSFQPESVTFLKDEEGNNYPAESIDPEGLAISPRNTIFISSEGNTANNIKPFLAEFDLETGKKLSDVRLPQRFLPSEDPEQPQGVRENLAFESLTINRTGLPEDPFRVFTATESSLIQDKSLEVEEPERIRFLHYIINPVGDPVLVAEHLYLLETAPAEVISNGLTELLALPTEGYFLSLERTFGLTGAGAKIFQVVIGNATDTSNIASLKGNLAQVRTLKKQLLFDLGDLDIELDNLEGITIGPRLPDGSKSLLLISDDNFNEEQINQLLLFRLSEN
ncbi:MAG: esterase-like activity of phytase family protein [Pleurocapsa sp. MO_226.B13]|nr:esterase-like activity of phytase family protein [Pleurocapsa sp. MO_226.B13]